MRGSEQELEVGSGSIIDMKALEENKQVGHNANNIPIFETIKSVMYLKRQQQQQQHTSSSSSEINNQIKKKLTTIQLILSDSNSNLPTSPTQPRNLTNTSLKSSIQNQQVINVQLAQSKWQDDKDEQREEKEEEEEEEDEDIDDEEEEVMSGNQDKYSAGNMEIAQERESINHLSQQRQQEISRVLAFYQVGLDQQKNLRQQDNQNNHDNNQNIGPSLFLHQNINNNNNNNKNNNVNNQENKQNENINCAHRQMNPAGLIPNQVIVSEENQQLGIIQQNQQVQLPLNGIQISIAQPIFRDALSESNQIGIGYFQLRHMIKILRTIIIFIIFTAFINFFLIIVSIVGLQSRLTSNFCTDARNFIWGVLLPILLFSSFVSVIDFYAVGLLYKREYKNLSKKELNKMRLKIPDLQNCNNTLRALRQKYPQLIVPQFFLKAGQFITIIFSSIYYQMNSDEITDQCQEIQEGHILQAYVIITTVILVNMIQYLTILILYVLTQLIRKYIIWKRKYDAQNLRNIRNCKLFKYQNETQLGKCESQCIICYMDYVVDEELTSLPCQAGHIFHKNCVGYWFEINQCCPTCKQTL